MGSRFLTYFVLCESGRILKYEQNFSNTIKRNPWRSASWMDTLVISKRNTELPGTAILIHSGKLFFLYPGLNFGKNLLEVTLEKPVVTNTVLQGKVNSRLRPDFRPIRLNYEIANAKEDFKLTLPLHKHFFSR